jgi:hypothetical protein
MMGKRGVTAVVSGVLVSAALAFGGVASAATTVGNSCTPNEALEAEALVVGLANAPSNPLPVAVPSAGVITSWTFNGLSFPTSASFKAQLKVLRPTSTPEQFTVAGETALTPVVVGINTFPARIPVQAGDLIAEAGLVTKEGESKPMVEFCKGLAAFERIGATPNGALGTSVMVVEEESTLGVPITVAVEPDADHDGYGDETQDQCPTDATTQGPCPTKAAPPAPAPITLSASAAAKKGLVTVTLTTSAQATVSVGGTVKLGKGKTTTLSGGTQIVAPGTLAKFTVLFPAKLKAALKQTPKSKKLSLALTASAPGAASTSITVKVPGQQKPAPKHHHRG